MSLTAPDSIHVLLLIAFGMAAMIALTNLLAHRLHVPQPILLVLVGAAVAFVPGAPFHELDPDLVLLLLLPPLLYSSGVSMSWRGFRNHLRPILLLAIGCVLFTATAVAAIAHWLLDLPWAVGFVLGAVVSPPDAVAPMAIARRLAVPRSILTILEGEGLVNDATALILFSFAINAVLTGHTSVPDALIKFGAIGVTEILWGLVVASVLLHLRWRTRAAEVEMVIALLTPFVAFWPPHFLGGSGVLAAVTAGLYTSRHGPRLIAPATRLQGFFVWGLAIYLIEAMVFMLTGLQARLVADSFATGRWQQMTVAAVVTVLVVTLIRFVWVFPVSLMPRSRTAQSPASSATWQATFLIGFTGIRGVVSLVAALSIPDLAGGQPFPQRDLIMFVTFCVILMSLVGQGALLPGVIRWLKLDQVGRLEADLAKQEEVAARVEAIEVAMQRLDSVAGPEPEPGMLGALRRLHEDRRAYFLRAGATPAAGLPAGNVAALRLQMLDAERGSIAARHAQGKLSDDARQRIERELDLEDARVRHSAESANAPGLI